MSKWPEEQIATTVSFDGTRYVKLEDFNKLLKYTVYKTLGHGDWVDMHYDQIKQEILDKVAKED